MRVHYLKLLVAVAAIVDAAEFKTTSGSPIDSSEQLNSTTGNDDGERAGFSSTTIREIQDHFALIGLKRSYKKLGLTESSYTALQHPNFLKWLDKAKKLAKKHPVSAIDILKKQNMNDYTLAKIIKAGKQDPKTRAYAVELEEAQLNEWLVDKRSVEAVFKMLLLNRSNDLFDAPLFSYWITYVERFYTAYPDKKSSLAASLAPCIEDRMEKLLKFSEAEYNAKKVDIMQFWLESGTSVREVYELLNLDLAGDILFTRPFFKYLMSYVKTYNTASPDLQFSLDNFIRSIDGISHSEKPFESALKIVFREKKVSQVKLDTTLLNLAQYWLDSETSDLEVFTLLKLDTIGDDLLTHSLFEYWTTYVRSFITAYPDKKFKHVNFVASYNGEDAVTDHDAVKLDVAQQWLDSMTSVEYVFRLLKLHTPGDDVFARPLFTYWSSYVYRFNMAYPAKRKSLYASLATCVGEVGVSILAEAGLKVRRSSNIAKILQADQFSHWILTSKSLWDVFVILQLDHAGDKLLEDPLMNTFLKFTTFFNRNNNIDLEQVFKAVQFAPRSPFSAFTDSEKALFQLWLVHEKRPIEVFTLLNLHKAGYNLVLSPLLTTLLKYVDTYRFTHPDKVVDMKEIITQHFDMFKVNRMIAAAKKLDKSRYIAKRLEDALEVKQWYLEDKPVEVKPERRFKFDEELS